MTKALEFNNCRYIIIIIIVANTTTYTVWKILVPNGQVNCLLPDSGELRWQLVLIFLRWIGVTYFPISGQFYFFTALNLNLTKFKWMLGDVAKTVWTV